MESIRSEDVISVDEGLEKLTICFREVQSILNRISIKDANYSPYFIKNVEEAIITIAMIEASGIGGVVEKYLDTIKQIMRFVERNQRGTTNGKHKARAIEINITCD